MSKNGDEENPDSFAVAVSWLTTYYESAEATVGRRVALTQWANSICFAISAAIAIVGDWGFQNSNLLPHATFVILGLCFFGAIYSGFWRQQLRTYRDLNSAKFEVLAELTAQIPNLGASNEMAVFFSAFQREWEVLRRRAKATLGSVIYENLLPMLFGLVFTLIVPLVVGSYWMMQLPANDWTNMLERIITSQ